MSTAERFTVALLLDGVRARTDDSGETIGPETLGELVHWFRTECAAIVASCPSEAVPLRLPKARINDLLSCELGTIARLGRTELAEPIVRGRLTDLVVAQHVTVGWADGGHDPSGAVMERDLRDGLDAAGDVEVLSWLDQAEPDVGSRLWRHAELVAARLRDSWGEIPRDWWPRTQERVSVEVADGVLLLATQFDLVLGGPPTGLPAVIIEVKAGEAADRHRRDLLWYGLVYALRHGRAPAVVATWTAADGGLVPVPVTIGVLEAAARRGLAALERLVALAAGGTPDATPHIGCRWCPELDRCEPGLASSFGRIDPVSIRDLQPDEDAEPWDPDAGVAWN